MNSKEYHRKVIAYLNALDVHAQEMERIKEMAAEIDSRLDKATNDLRAFYFDWKREATAKQEAIPCSTPTVLYKGLSVTVDIMTGTDHRVTRKELLTGDS